MAQATSLHASFQPQGMVLNTHQKLAILVGLLCGFFDAYLIYRQIRALHSATFPFVYTLSKAMNKPMFQLLRRQELIQYYLEFLYKLACTAFECFVIWYGLLPIYWKLSSKPATWLNISDPLVSETICSLFFVTAAQQASWLLYLPFALLYHIIIGRTLEFILNMVSFVSAGAFNFVVKDAAFFAVKLFIWHRWHRNALLVFFIASVASVLILSVIEDARHSMLPQFPSSPLGLQIHKLASKYSLPLDHLHLDPKEPDCNAKTTGFFPFQQRIVVFKKLVDELEAGVVLAVVGHEFGHFVNSHVFKRAFLGMLFDLMTTVFYYASIHRDVLHLAFGFASKQSSEEDKDPPEVRSSEAKPRKTSFFVGIVLVNLFISPFIRLGHYSGKTATHLHEYEADNFACKLGFNAGMFSYVLGSYDAEDANRGTGVSDTLHDLVMNSHPNTINRLEHINESLIVK